MSGLATMTKEPPQFVDPLALDTQMARVDKAVNDIIDGSVSHIEDEITRIMRRREVASAVRRVHFLRNELGEIVKSGMGSEMINTYVDGVAAEMQEQFKHINPGADPKLIEAAVEKTIAAFRQEPEEEKKKRGKSSAG